MSNQTLTQFTEAVRTHFERGELERLVLANYRGSEPDLQRVLARRIVLRGESWLSLLYKYKTRDITKNFRIADGVAELLRLIEPDAGQGFGHANLLTPDLSIDLRTSKKGQVSLVSHRLSVGNPASAGTSSEPPTTPATEATAHDRSKHRWLTLESACWQDLGITDAQGRLIPAMSRKWKQINKFVEVLDSAWRESTLADHRLDSKPLRVMDFGAGKGYLSFAVAAFLNQTLGVRTEVTGVELRADLVELCNRSAEQRQVDGLKFEQGDVVQHEIGAIDIMIALHACDTATDHAIHKGITAGAQIILCSPCCHKELRPQLQSPGLLRPMLQHGIHLGQQAEMITDSLRALLLEAHGYHTKVFEFVSLEHTSKNKMILAVKRAGTGPSDEVFAQIRQIKDFYGVREHCLERLLGAAAVAAPAGGASPAR